MRLKSLAIRILYTLHLKHTIFSKENRNKSKRNPREIQVIHSSKIQVHFPQDTCNRQKTV